MPTDKQIDQANDVLKQAYWDYVREWGKATGDHLREQWCDDPNDATDRAYEIINEFIEPLVEQYTRTGTRSLDVLRYTDNADHILDVSDLDRLEQFSHDPRDYIREVAYWALYRDLMDQAIAEFDPDDYDPDDDDEVREVCGKTKRKGYESASSRKRKLIAL